MINQKKFLMYLEMVRKPYLLKKNFLFILKRNRAVSFDYKTRSTERVTKLEGCTYFYLLVSLKLSFRIIIYFNILIKFQQCYWSIIVVVVFIYLAIRQ